MYSRRSELGSHHHYHVVPLARISLTLSRHFSLSFITSGWSSGLHPVSSRSCCMYVLAGRPVVTRAYVGVHMSTSFMWSSLLLQQCPACLVRLTWIVFVMGGRWPYSWCFVGCCRQDLFNIAHNSSDDLYLFSFFKVILSRYKSLVTAPRTPITIRIIITFMFHSFFSILEQDVGIFLFSFFFFCLLLVLLFGRLKCRSSQFGVQPQYRIDGCLITVLNRHSYLKDCHYLNVVQVERTKLFNYPMVYLLLQFLGSRREQEREAEVTTLARQRETSWWERDSRYWLWIFLQIFCCIINMLGDFQRVKLLLKPNPQNVDCKLSLLHIFTACVHLRVFSSSLLAHHSLKRVVPSLLPGIGWRNIPRIHAWFWDIQFSLVIFK